MSKNKVEEIEEKIKKLKAQKQSIIAKEKEKARKERTRRLIQIGAVIESRLNFDLEKTELLCDYLYNTPGLIDKIKNYINNKTNQTSQVNNTIKK